MKTPKFWYQKHSRLAKLLSPLGRVYGWTVQRRFKKTRPYQATIPVICVGNLSIGGTGKTPVCLAIGQMLKERGIAFWFLNHGYKSQSQGVIVDPDLMTPLDVGDEALLLAAMAPTVVDRHRARGAQIIERHGAKALIMDDGFQNPSLIKTLSLIVADGQTGFGNGRLIPAGPLREPIERGLKRADAVVIAGADRSGIAETVRKTAPDLPILSGHFEPDSTTIKDLKGLAVVAFAGIGRPDKFFEMLTGLGIPVAKRIAFPDHYFYTRFDLEQLLADAGDMPLVTTRKDFVKIPPELRTRVRVVDGCFVFDRPDEVLQLILGAGLT